MFLRLTVFLAIPALSLLAQPAAPSLRNLVTNSPFASFGPVNSTAAANAPLEFRGTFVESGERFFSILDTGTRRAEWVGLNEPGQLFAVKNYHPEREAITVEFQGRVMELNLHSARVAVLAAAPPPPPPNNTAAVSGQNRPAAAATAPAGNEAQRLAQVAEEIRRRRALRQQATQPGQLQTQPPAPPNR
ncbi:MAG: hypothetical protein Q8M02_14540 [Candidatus Didemnitutus sp.]|nr:hypothetical protein [Candidatus Didemnitutus sp.]